MGETLETVKESIEFARKSPSDFTNFYAVLPYRGTPQWEYINRCGTLYSREIHTYHTTRPRIVFETPEFSYQERLEAIRLVKKYGFYSNRDTKSVWFDFAKVVSLRLQKVLPERWGTWLYLLLKLIYRGIKKHNI